MEVSGQFRAPTASRMGGLVGPKAGLLAMEKKTSLVSARKFYPDSSAAQPVAHRK
jgi:hypothetical protein